MSSFGTIAKKVSSYIYEFLVLFASIFGAFQLEDWDEVQDNVDREITYLASMHEDLSKDINQLNRRILEYQEKIENAETILLLLEDPFEDNREEIRDLFKSHLQYHFSYNPINNTLETLKTSGDLKLVQNHNFKLLLSELDKSYTSTFAQGNIFTNYIASVEWMGFFINSFDLQTLKPIINNPNTQVLFRNKVQYFITLVESYYFHMQGTLQKLNEVQEALEKELKSRDIRLVTNGEENNINEDILNLEDDLSTIEDDLSLDDLPTEEELETEDNGLTKEESDELDDLEGLLDELESDSLLQSL